MVVIASYCVLFAIMSGSTQAVGLETAAFSVFVLVSVIGFRTNLWLVAGALAGHGLFDFIHPLLIANTGVPVWWPMFCLTYDVVAGLYLAWFLRRSALAAESIPAPTGQAETQERSKKN
jgi:hypothetical protein